MKTEDIKKMGLAYVQVLEAKKVNKHGHDAVGQEDDDIDNDGDVDKSDSYLHNRRKAIKATMKKEEVEELDEISRDTARSYIRKASADNAQRKADVMKPFPMKDMEKNVSQYKKMKSREKGIETAGKKAYGIGGAAKVAATESTEWPVFKRIQEKNMYKVSGVGDDPHTITVKFADEKHTKGATKAEPIDSKFSQGEKDWVKAHGGHDGNESGINGHEAAAHTAKVATANVKAAPGRHNDQKVGDKTMPKPKG